MSGNRLEDIEVQLVQAGLHPRAVPPLGL